MNEVLKNIEERRSIRKYKEDMIPKEIIEKIVEAGTYAPSGMGMQSSIIIAITNRSVRDKLSKLNAKIMGREGEDPFYGAPVVIVVLAKKDVPTHVYDGSLVMENLMLAANSLGIGSCWIHRAKEEFETEEGKEILKTLGINPLEYEGIANCILGYKDEEGNLKPRKDNYAYYID